MANSIGLALKLFSAAFCTIYQYSGADCVLCVAYKLSEFGYFSH